MRRKTAESSVSKCFKLSRFNEAVQMLSFILLEGHRYEARSRRLTVLQVPNKVEGIR